MVYTKFYIITKKINMQKAEWSITEYHDWYKVENMLFTYTEEEKQRNKINENNASLIMFADFYCIYNSQLSMDTTLAEDRILWFLYYRTKNWKYIYVKNEDLQKLIKWSEATVGRTLKSLEDKWYIDMSIKRIVWAWTDRKLRLSHTALILMSQSRQIDDSESSNWWAIKEYIKRIEENNITQKLDGIQEQRWIEFEEFWKKYPNKKWKDGARKARGKMKQEEKELAYKSIELHQKYDINWNRENWQFIPYGSTYLNQKRREDEFDESKPIQNEIVIWATAPDWHTYTEKDKPGSWYYWDSQYKIYRRWSK